jgi:hypothetical protein
LTPDDRFSVVVCQRVLTGKELAWQTDIQG